MLQRDALQEADVTHQLYNPAIPQRNPQPQVEEQGRTIKRDGSQGAPTAQMQAQTAVLPRDDEVMTSAHAGMMAGVTISSNAFEGALDGSNFGMGGLEPFAMDSSSWYTGDWMDPDPSRHTGLM